LSVLVNVYSGEDSDSVLQWLSRVCNETCPYGMPHHKNESHSTGVVDSIQAFPKLERIF